MFPLGLEMVKFFFQYFTDAFIHKVINNELKS
jgi:hypothetical protein